MNKSKIWNISIKDKHYPDKLKQIYNPPRILYGIGNKEILSEFSIGMVGCRNYSEYGKKAALYFSYELSKKGIHIVSGLAKGIDSFSHIGCLKGNAKTIAVLAGGFLTIYPKENEKLCHEIVNQGGCILSEYLPEDPPKKYYFIARNRIISGISDGILVVEAKKKSATSIIVDFALEQGRQVFAVPGNINNPNANGTNELIKQGAKLTTGLFDILEEYR